MRFLDELERACEESVKTGLTAAQKLSVNVDGLYGSGARLICTPKPGEVDLNVFSEGAPLKTVVKGAGLNLVSLQLPPDIDPLTEYPQPERQKSFLPVGAVLAWHARPLTRRGEQLIRRVVSRMSREDRILTAKAALWKSYELALNASRPKDLVRAACDLAPYALNWLRNPDDLPSLRQKSIRDVVRDGELLELCERALEAKATGGEIEQLKQDVLSYLERVRAHEHRRDFEELKRRMKPWTAEWREPLVVGEWRATTY